MPHTPSADAARARFATATTTHLCGPLTSDVRSLKARGESTTNGWTSRISRPACGLQSIQITC